MTEITEEDIENLDKFYKHCVEKLEWVGDSQSILKLINNKKLILESLKVNQNRKKRIEEIRNKIKRLKPIDHRLGVGNELQRKIKELEDLEK